MLLVSILLGLLAAPLVLGALSDALALLRLPWRRRAAGVKASVPGRLLFLVPAHDEEAMIGPCLESLARLDYPADRFSVVVVADNCSDDTAGVARLAGMQVLERTDTTLRGKPHAIAWALDQLPLAEYDAVSIIDADAIVHPGYAAAMGRLPGLRGASAQSFNGVSNPNENALTRLSNVFATVRCALMNGLKERAGLNTPMGCGLCIGTDVLRQGGWTAFSICEDWEMYTQLTIRGVRVHNVVDARVFAQETRSLDQSASQRQRWAAGKIAVARRYIPEILAAPGLGQHQRLDAIAELLATGPIVQLGTAALLGAVVLLLRPPATPLLLALLALPIARLGIYTLAAIRREPQPLRAIGAFAFLPLYTFWRLLVQLRAIAAVSDGRWVRTQRHAQPSS